jgi:hypothetical protein
VRAQRATHVLMTLADTDRPAASPAAATRKRPMQLDTAAEDSAVRRVYDMTLDSHHEEDDSAMPPFHKRVRSGSADRALAAAAGAASAPGAGDSHEQVMEASSSVAAATTATAMRRAPNADQGDPEDDDDRGSLVLHRHRMMFDIPAATHLGHGSTTGGMYGASGGGVDGMLLGSTFQDDSDAGSSSCKDVEDPGVLAPDSVPAMVAELRKLIDYVASKPTLQCGSASFMRDYLRTMLIQNALAAKEAVAVAARAAKETDRLNGLANSDLSVSFNHVSLFRAIPDELSKHIFSFLDGKHLATAREVCAKWNEFACEEHLWKDLCLKRWRSLETDKEAWKLIDKNVVIDAPNPWRKIYPTVSTRPQWPCRLQKTGRFICNLIAHQISGAALGPSGLPHVLVVERRFNILHLQTFVLPDASVLYFEPETEDDRAGFNDFIEYLTKRTRAGLALEEQRRFIFIPPCDYTRTQVGYNGLSLLGVVQNAYPPLAP